MPDFPPLAVYLAATLASLAAVAAAASRTREWVFAVVTALTLVTTLTTGRLLEVGGWTLSLGSAFYAGVYLGIDALSEHFRKVDAARAVYYGLAANAILLVAGALAGALPLTGYAVDATVAQAFAVLPRVVLAGLVAFGLAARLEVELYARLRRVTAGRRFGLALRNNGSTIPAQLLDATLFYAIAFYGLLPRAALLELIATGWLIRVAAALLDTPFLYIVGWMRGRPGRRARAGRRAFAKTRHETGGRGGP